MPKKKPVVEENDFDVECILKARPAGKKWEYFIKWGGYSQESNSWEPEKNLTNCKRLLNEFWAHTGKSRKDSSQTSVGEEVSPSQEWIEKQLKNFRTTSEKKMERRRRKGSLNDTDGKDDKSIIEPTDTIRNPKANDVAVQDLSQYSDPDDIPLSQKVPINLSLVQPVEAKNSKRKLLEEQDNDDNVQSRKRSRLMSGLKNVEGSDSAGDNYDSLFTDSDDEPLTERMKSVEKDGKIASKPVNLSKPIQRGESQLPPQVASTSVETRSSPLEAGSPPHEAPLPKFKPNVVPPHIQRKMNPRVKQLPAELSAQFSGISTKARISGQADTSCLKENMSASGISRTDAPPMHVTSAMPSVAIPKERIKKRWRWTGELAIGDNESEQAYAEIIGEVELRDDFALELSPTSLSINQLLPGHSKVLCLRYPYALSLLIPMLSGFNISHFAKMYQPTTDNDNFFQELIVYMTNNHLFSFTPLYIRSIRAATLFIFPPCFDEINGMLNVPLKLCHGDGLLVAIAIQAYHVLQGNSVDDTWKSHGTLIKNGNRVPLERNMSLLGFPASLFERVNGKACALLFPNKGPLDTETSVLYEILSKARGAIVSLSANPPPRFVFVHVAAWSGLHQIHSLVDKRMRQSIYFFTYGSHPSVPRKFWGIQEIFPIGGVVTFTPRAIAEAPEAVHTLIGKLVEHPLWDCYVIPATIGMMADMIESEQSETKLENLSTLDALCKLLSRIEGGQLTLMTHPPNIGNLHSGSGNLDDKILQWGKDQDFLSCLPGYQLVFECQRRLKSSRHPADKDVDGLIVKDMTAMQSGFRTEFRRFVIIADTSIPTSMSKDALTNRDSIRREPRDMFEWTHVDKFTFNDNFFEATETKNDNSPTPS